MRIKLALMISLISGAAVALPNNAISQATGQGNGVIVQFCRQPTGHIIHVNSGQSVATIQTTVSGANAGDTVYLDPGSYSWSTTAVTLKSGVNMFGKYPLSIISNTGTGANAAMHLNTSDGKNIIIHGLVFNGGYVDMEGASATAGEADNITIINNYAENMASLAGPVAAFYYVYLRNSNITQNYCTGISGDTGQGSCINGYDAETVRITHNFCTLTYQCYSGVWQSIAGTGDNIYTGYNVSNGTIHRMALEYQDNGPGTGPPASAQGMIIERNDFRNWQSNASGNRFGISEVLDTSNSVTVRDNYMACGTGGTCDYGMESSGNMTSNNMGNYIDHFAAAGYVYEAGWTFDHNNYLNITGGCTGNACVLYGNTATSGNTTVTNNTTDSTKPVPNPPWSGPWPSCPY